VPCTERNRQRCPPTVASTGAGAPAKGHDGPARRRPGPAGLPSAAVAGCNSRQPHDHSLPGPASRRPRHRWYPPIEGGTSRSPSATDPRRPDLPRWRWAAGPASSRCRGPAAGRPDAPASNINTAHTECVARTTEAAIANDLGPHRARPRPVHPGSVDLSRGLLRGLKWSPTVGLSEHCALHDVHGWTRCAWRHRCTTHS
jgi:hypothetical protein